VSKHSQTRAAPSSDSRSAAVLVPLGVGAVLTGVAWFYLVGAAIDFGVLAVNGNARAWLFTLGASVGAVVCMMLMLALVARGLRVVGLISDYKPRRAAPRRRRH